MQDTIQISDLIFEPYCSEADVQVRCAAIAAELNRDYQDKSPIFIAVLNGSFMFAAALMKYYIGDAQITFVKLASYHGVNSSGSVKSLMGLDVQIQGKDVVIIEDIVDTGLTLQVLSNTLMAHSPKSLKVATLLFKPLAVKHPIKPDYIGFEMPNSFFVGFGLDYNGFGRNLPTLYQLKNT